MEIEEKGRVDELIIIGRGAITIREQKKRENEGQFSYENDIMGRQVYRTWGHNMFYRVKTVTYYLELSEVYPALYS